MLRLVRLLVLFPFACVPVFAQQPGTPVDAKALYEAGMNGIIGTGVSRNDVTAVQYFRESATLGYAPAQDVMGYLSETGTVVPQDNHEALAWYSKAAKQGDSLAQWVLGRMYYTGTGEIRDLNEAASWLMKASAQGDAFAQLLLGSVLLERQAYAQAAEDFRQAAEQGLPQAQQQLGLLLKQGRGTVPEDKSDAYVWLLLSFDAGLQNVGEDIKQLEADLGSTNVDRLKTEVRKREDITRRSLVAHGCTGWHGEFDLLPTTPPPEIQRFCR